MIRNSRGSVQQRLNQETLKEIHIPILLPETQNDLANMVKNSHEMRTKSKQILEIAKKGIDMAIEQSEQIAESWIIEQIQRLQINV